MSEKKADNKRVFEVEIDGEKVKIAVIKPKMKHLQKATQIYNKSFREAADSGAILRARLESVAREQKVWDDDKQTQFEELTKQLLDGELKLAKGGIKLSEGRKVAIDMRVARFKRTQLQSGRNQLDQMTAEAQAENAKFQYLISVCTVYGEGGKEGQPYYESYEDMMELEEDPVYGPAFNQLGNLVYGLDENYDAQLPENKFLVKYGFCNEKLHLIRKSDSRLINGLDQLVDEKGRRVNEDGKLIDPHGRVIDEDGNYVVQFEDFEDDTAGQASTQAEPLEANAA